MEGEDDNNTDDGNAAATNKGGNSATAGGDKDKQSNGKATITKAPGGKGLTNNSGGKGKQLSNMAGNPNNAAANENNNNRKRSVSFSVDRQSSNITTDVGGMMDDGTNMMNDIGSLNNDAVILGRWHAPYLKDIPTFPITGLNPEDIANPHRLPGSQISLSMHDYATEMEACRESTTTTTAALKRRGSSSGNDAAQSATAKAKKLQIDMAEKSMIMALRIPDDVYAKKDVVWGAIKDSNEDDDTLMPDVDSKKSAGEKKLDSGKATTTAKVKFDPSTKQQSKTSSLNELSEPQIHRPSYVPNFLPPFPTNEYSDLADERLVTSISTSSVMGDVMSRMQYRKEKRKASDISATSNDNDQKKKMMNGSERDSVRRSVIGLGKKSVGISYWGSNWLDGDNAEAGGGTHTKSNSIGLSDVTGALVEEGGNNTVAAAAASPKKSNSDVQPLVRASGSRLSKILEGSMT